MWSFLGELSGYVPVFCTIWYDSGYALRQFTVSVWQQRQSRTVQTVPEIIACSLACMERHTCHITSSVPPPPAHIITHTTTHQHQHTHNHKHTHNQPPPPPVVVEVLSTCQDSHLTGKPGAGQGSPLRVAPCPAQSDTGQNYYVVWGTCQTPRLPCHGERFLAEPWTRSGFLGARAKVGRFAQSAPLRKGRWEGRWSGRGGGGGGRGGAGYVWTVCEMACFLFHVQWTSSCDHAATSTAVLYRSSYDVGVVPQLQFIDRVFLPRCEQRQVPTVAFSFSRIRGVAVQ